MAMDNKSSPDAIVDDATAEPQQEDELGTLSKDMPPDLMPRLSGFWKNLLEASSSSSSSSTTTTTFSTKDLYSHLLRGLLTVLSLHPGHVTCLLSVKSPVLNAYGGLHGGAVAAVAEMVSIASARTVVTSGKELFLGELSTSYLSGAPLNSEILVEGHVIRSGRNVVATTVEFKLKKTRQLIYAARATFYVMPIARL